MLVIMVIKRCPNSKIPFRCPNGFAASRPSKTVDCLAVGPSHVVAPE
jgi:hypothetical protein